MITKEQYLKAYEIVMEYQNQVVSLANEISLEVQRLPYKNINPETLIQNTDMSFRARNSIRIGVMCDPWDWDIVPTIQDIFEHLPMRELRKFRNFGKGCELELTNLYKRANLI